jgi:BirA family biotin operon repressor/biotin-[acetyl-CoA-carboxylase] ligase
VHVARRARSRYEGRVHPRVFRHGIVDSSSERAFVELAADRARHFDVHVAHGQTAGRGRLGRRWHSEPGLGLYASVVLLPPRPWAGPALTMALGLAVQDAVSALGLPRARLDWPNDVVVGAAKLAGILVEARDLDPARPAYVAGVGLNVRQRAFDPALAAERAVTSLLLEGVDRTLDEALAALLAALPARLALLAGPRAPLEEAYARAAGLAAGRVRVELAEGALAARLERWSIDEGLVLRTDSGELRQVALEHVRGLARAD